MADINQFQRSRDKIVELLQNLTAKKTDDPETASYINSLEIALKTLELKREAYMLTLNNSNKPGSLDLSF